jgi:PAS domain S-box-containing protein
MADAVVFFDLVPEALLVWDEKGIIRAWNRQAEALYNVPAASAVGKLRHDVLQCEASTTELILESSHGSQRWQGQLQCGFNGSGTKLVNSVASWRKLSDHDVIVESHRISADRMVTPTIEENGALYRAFGEVMLDFLWCVLPDGRATYVNPAWQAYTGLTLEDFNRLGPTVFTHPEDFARASADWERARATGGKFETQFRYRRHDGVYRWFLLCAAPVRNEQGEITQWVGVSTDIEELHRASEASERARAELEAVVSSMGEGLLVCDSTGTITHVNRAARRIHGFADDQSSLKRL